MAMWPSEEPSRANDLRPRREYWIQGVPTPGIRRPRRWRWVVGGVALLALVAGGASYLEIRRTQIASPVTPATADKEPFPAPTPAPVVASPNSPESKLVVGLPSVSGPSDQQRVDQMRPPNTAPETHYAVGLRPITVPERPPAPPADVASPPTAPEATALANPKPPPKRVPQGPSTRPTSGQVRF